MRLLLFDIDGTLLRVDGGGDKAIQQAVSVVTGRSVKTDNVRFSGRTDPAILQEVLDRNGIPTREGLLDEIVRAYTEAALEGIGSTNVDLLPGVADLVRRLDARDDVILGLVTGNVERVAFHKLASAELSKHFSVGAFGSDHADRSVLPGLAIRRASDYYSHSFSAEESVIIGDTGHDVQCARHAGATAVAVSTGRPSASALADHSPDLLLGSLRNAERVVEQLFSL